MLGGRLQGCGVRREDDRMSLRTINEKGEVSFP